LGKNFPSEQLPKIEGIGIRSSYRFVTLIQITAEVSVNRLSLLLALALPAMVLQAQAWDPMKSATGWARFDKDSSCTFYNPVSRKLVTIMRDGSNLNEIDLSRLEGIPEKWVLDPSMNAWVIVSGVAQFVEKNGKLGPSVKLPGEVADVAWDPKGFLLSYRSTEPYVEKLDYKNGSNIWKYGTKPKKGEPAATVLHRILVNDENHVALATGNTLHLNLIDGNKGKLLGQAVFTLNDQNPPAIDLGGRDRGPMVWWLNKGTAITAIAASQAPGLKETGLVLVRQDFTSSTLTVVPTGLSEDHLLVGAVENDAILIAPKGGLVTVPLIK